MNYTTIQPLLSTVNQQLKWLYQDRLKDIYLFGSYARGEATEQSDIDLLVVLNDDTVSPFREIEAMSELTYQLSLDYDTLITVIPVARQRFEKYASPLYRIVKQEGRRL